MNSSDVTKVPAKINDPAFMKKMMQRIKPSKLAYYDKIDLLIKIREEGPVHENFTGKTLSQM